MPEGDNEHRSYSGTQADILGCVEKGGKRTVLTNSTEFGKLRMRGGTVHYRFSTMEGASFWQDHGVVRYCDNAIPWNEDSWDDNSWNDNSWNNNESDNNTCNNNTCTDNNACNNNAEQHQGQNENFWKQATEKAAQVAGQLITSIAVSVAADEISEFLTEL